MTRKQRQELVQYKNAVQRIKIACSGKRRIDTKSIYDTIEMSLSEKIIVGTKKESVVEQLHDIWFPPTKE